MHRGMYLQRHGNRFKSPNNNPDYRYKHTNVSSTIGPRIYALCPHRTP